MRFLILIILLFSSTTVFAGCGPFDSGGTPDVYNIFQPGISSQLAEAILFPAPVYADFDTPYDGTSSSTALTKVSGMFNCRLNEFVEQMRTTGIFGLAANLNIGSLSGDSAFTIDSGQYGNHSIDLAFDFPAFAFYLIRGVVLFLAGFCALSFVIRGQQ